jgi:hypothetical protein
MLEGRLSFTARDVDLTPRGSFSNVTEGGLDVLGTFTVTLKYLVSD